MNEKMSKRRIQIRELQKQEIEEKEERRLLIMFIWIPVIKMKGKNGILLFVFNLKGLLEE